MDIYAPLAERIGMYEIMNEMQTPGLPASSRPDAYASITTAAGAAARGGRRPDQPHRPRPSACCSPTIGLDAEVTGREKHPYSIWNKMAERHISFEQLSDVMAFRVIVEDTTTAIARWA